MPPPEGARTTTAPIWGRIPSTDRSTSISAGGSKETSRGSKEAVGHAERALQIETEPAFAQ